MQNLMPIRLLLLAGLLATLLAACGGGDDVDPTATTAAPANVTPTSVAATATATATSEPTRVPSEPPATATVAPSTPTSAPTEDASAASPTAATGEGLSEDEQALMDVLVSPADLPGEWSEVRREVPVVDGGPGICGAPRFPQADERTAQVEVELTSAGNASSILQNLTFFPDDVAVAALEYARENSTCGEFTDEDGLVIGVEQIEAPALGDEALALTLTFDVEGTTIQGDAIFVRVGGLVSIVSLLTSGEYDPESAAQVASIATDRMRAALGRTVGISAEDDALLDQLLVQADFPQGWNLLSVPAPSAPEEWIGLCDSGVNPDSASAIARVSTSFYEGLAASDAAVQQVLTHYPSGGGPAAMDWERDALGCSEFTAGTTTVTLSTADYESDADDVVAVTFAYIDANSGAVEGNWIVAQVGDLVTNIIYTDPQGVDADLVQDLIDAAVERMSATP